MILPTVRLDALTFLARQENTPGPGKWERLEPAHALLALLPYAHLMRRLDPGEAIRRLKPVIEAVPASDLGRGVLSDMVKAIECVLKGTD